MAFLCLSAAFISCSSDDEMLEEIGKQENIQSKPANSSDLNLGGNPEHGDDDHDDGKDDDKKG